MDLKLLRGILLEELGRICHATRGLLEVLAEIEQVVGRRGILDPMAQSEARQAKDFRRMLDRFGAVIPEKSGPAVEGLFAELREDLSRQSGLYPPVAADFRLLAGLDRILHHKMAALRSGILAAHLMETQEIEREFERCLNEEGENSRRLTALAGNTLRLCGAISREEVAGALAERKSIPAGAMQSLSHVLQSEKIILIPSSDEQATPCFHLERHLLEPFLEHLSSRGVETWQPPEPLDALDAEGAGSMEIEIKEEYPIAELEKIRSEFLHDSRLASTF